MLHFFLFFLTNNNLLLDGEFLSVLEGTGLFGIISKRKEIHRSKFFPHIIVLQIHYKNIFQAFAYDVFLHHQLLELHIQISKYLRITINRRYMFETCGYQCDILLFKNHLTITSGWYHYVMVE